MSKLRAKSSYWVLCIISAALFTLLWRSPIAKSQAGEALRIVFYSDRDGSTQLYVMDADGTNVEQLTRGGRFNYAPACSPDGQQIAYTHEYISPTYTYIMNADGTNARPVPNAPSRSESPAWSPDGTQLAFHVGIGSNQIYRINIDGTNLTALTDNAVDLFPSWSPTGAQIAFDSNRDGNSEIYVMNALDGSNLRRLTVDPANDQNPEWSPDGTQIAFSSDRDGETRIYTMDSSTGANVQNVIGTLTGAAPSWSPDGSMIAFISYQDNNNEIYTVNLSDMSVNRLTNNSVLDASPCWITVATVPPTANAGLDQTVTDSAAPN
jgi:Tol biopolymer transport system component